MSLRPLAHYLKTPLGTTTSSDLTDVRLTVRSVETVVLGTGTLTQTVAVVAANEVRPLTDVTIQVTNGQFLSDATLTVASAYHRHADLITFDYTPSDIPAGRSIFIVDDRNATTLATITNASSGLLRLSLDATTNTWIVTETIDSTDTNPTFGTVSVTGTIRNANGTTLLPSYTFSSDTTAGMLYAGSGGVKIATSGLQAVLFSGVDQSATFSGNIIGTGALNAINVASGVTPFTELEVDSTSASSPRGIMSAQFSTDTGGARLHLRKARGTRATPTTVVTGDNLGRLVGTGYDGANYLEMASIYFASEGTIAATRIPTNIQFWTATNATPSVLTLAGQFNSSQQLLVTNGTAAAPSYSFAALTNTGFGRTVGQNEIFVSIAGTNSFYFDANGQIFGAQGSNYLQLNSLGAISAVAAGTNQSITLTPSGTGLTTINGTSGREIVNLSFAAPNAVIWSFLGDGGASKQLGISVSGQAFASAPLILDGNSGGANLKLTNGHALLGGLTTDGTGVLQFPAATTSAGGITFGTDWALFRQSAAALTAVSTAGSSQFNVSSANSTIGLIAGSAGTTIASNLGSLVIQSGSSVTAITLDSSQNATFAAGTTTKTDNIATSSGGTLTIKSGAGPTTALTINSTQDATFSGKATVTKPIIAVPSALTYASPTSVDVTLASVYTVTTVNATGSVTFNATAGGTAGQEMTIIITNDATSAKTITFGTNFKSTGTLTASAVSRQTTISFRSDGTNFCETSRAVLTS